MTELGSKLIQLNLKAVLLIPIESTSLLGKEESYENIYTEITYERENRSKCWPDHPAIYPFHAKRLVEWVELLNTGLGCGEDYLIIKVYKKKKL